MLLSSPVGSPMADIMQHGIHYHENLCPDAAGPGPQAAAFEQTCCKAAAMADAPSVIEQPFLPSTAWQSAAAAPVTVLYAHLRARHEFGNTCVSSRQQQQLEAPATSRATSEQLAAQQLQLHVGQHSQYSQQRVATSDAPASATGSCTRQQHASLAKQQPPSIQHSHTRLPPRPAAVAVQGQHAAPAGLNTAQGCQQQCSSSHSHESSSAGWRASPAAAAVACPPSVGSWCGSYAVIHHLQDGSQDSDAGTGNSLECEEEVLSMDTAGDERVQQQRLVSKHKDVDDDGDEDHNSRDQLNHHHHQQQQQAATESSVLVLQALDRAACARKGNLVLTASAARAELSGAASVRPRLLITEVSVYMHNAACSRLALKQANTLLASMKLPDGVTYMPVSPESLLFKAGAAWQFPAFAMCLGSNYMQRILERLPQLADAALACSGFEDYCDYLHNKPRILPPQLTGQQATACLATLRSILFTCLFLALKVADQVHAMGLLRFMLSHLNHSGDVVSLAAAAGVEARCLEALDWRLGPFFAGDELCSNNEDLWAAGMAHWDYGSEADLAL